MALTTREGAERQREMVEVGGKDAKAVHIPRTEIFLSRRVSVGFRQAPEITSS